MSETITYEDTILAVQEECRNWFNEHNSPDDPPVDSPKYERFKKLCNEIHAFRLSPAGKESPYTSESVYGAFSKTRATRADGLPIGWIDVFAKRLKPYRMMFENTGR